MKDMIKCLDLHRQAYGTSTTVVLRRVKNIDKIEKSFNKRYLN